MKERSDVNTTERSFKPGQKVLALLPVPGNPLQARYFRPYVIKEKFKSSPNYGKCFGAVCMWFYK